MGRCVICDRPVSLFGKQHKECKERFESGIEKIILLIESSVSNQMPLNTLEIELRKISNYHFLTENTVKSALLKGWESAAEKVFKDIAFIVREAPSLEEIPEQLSLEYSDLEYD